MKKSTFFLLATLTFSSCHWEIPKSVSVKTEAKYEFSLGEYSGDLSQYLSVKTLTETLEDSTSDIKFKIYDYYPTHSDESLLPMQQFLIDFPIQSISLDIADYLKEMDFSTALENMSFAPDIVDLKDFKMDNIDPISVKLDINKRIEDSANLIQCTVKIPKKGGESGFPKELLDSMTATINIKEPTFDKMTFYNARIDFTAQPTDDDTEFSTHLTLALFNDGETEPISKIENVNLPEHNFSFPLDGKTIKSKLHIKVLSGSATYWGSSDSLTIDYTLSSALKAVKIKSVDNLTIEDPISVPIGTDVGSDGANITINIGKSPKCEIGKGSIDIIAKQSETWNEWQGITITPKVSLKGEINAEPDDFITDPKEGDGYFMYRTKSLDGVTYHNNGKITVKGEVTAEIKNANIQFEENEEDTITIEPTCTIEEISRLWLDLTGDDFQTEYNESQSIGEEITKYITAFGIEEKIEYKNLFVLYVDYTNTLPEGNDISLSVKSNYFEINDEKKLEANKKDVKTTISSKEALKEKTLNENDKIDFHIQWDIPGRGEDAEYPNCVILKNLKMEGSYELKVNVTPTLNWDYVKITANGIEETGASDTGMNFKDMFKDLEEKLSDATGDENILEKMDLVEMPLYFYCVMPLTGGVELKGKVTIGSGSLENGKPRWDKYDKGSQKGKDACTPLVGDKNEYKPLESLSSLPKLTFFEDKNKESKTDSQNDSEDELKMVIEALEKNKQNPNPVDIAELFNLKSGSNIIFDYGMTLGGGSGENIKLSKLSLTSEGDESQKDDAPIAIQFHARLVVPLEIELTDDINLSFARLLDKDSEEDLFKRSEATSIDILDNVLNSLDYAEINAYFPEDTGVIRYFNKTSGNKVVDTETNMRLTMDPKVEGIEEPFELDIGKNEPFKIKGDDFSKILKEYPFTPDIQFVVPQGCFYIRHNFEYALKMELGTKFNGEAISIFGDEK